MWDKVRLTGYTVAFLSAVAALAKMIGVADYDQLTGMVDLHPFNVNYIGAVVGAALANVVAMLAVWRKWGRK